MREVTAGSGGTGAWHHMQGHGRGNVAPPGSWHHMWVHGRKATVTAAEVTAAGVTAAGLDNTSLGVISRRGHGSRP